MANINNRFSSGFLERTNEMLRPSLGGDWGNWGNARVPKGVGNVGIPYRADFDTSNITSEFNPTGMEEWFGYYNPESKSQVAGKATTALSALTGLGNLYFGMKQYGIAKDQLSENKRQFDLNYNNQKNMVNSQLEDRQRARVASNPNGYQSVGEYMNKYGV